MRYDDAQLPSAERERGLAVRTAVEGKHARRREREQERTSMVSASSRMMDASAPSLPSPRNEPASWKKVRMANVQKRGSMAQMFFTVRMRPAQSTLAGL